ncbi:hypothetical protein ABTP72_19680, partial [Acinetobacter baumannii]
MRSRVALVRKQDDESGGGMDFKVLLGAVMLVSLSVAGCATKNYGRQPELTDFERQTMSCREIDLAQA